MLSFIPDSYLQTAINIIIAVGVVLFILTGLLAPMFRKFFREGNAYIYPIHLLSIVLVVGGAFFKGSYDTELAWRAKVEEVQSKVDKAETQSKTVNVKLAKKEKQQEKIIIVHQASTEQYINTEVKKYDNTCEIPNPFIKALNEAAEKPK